MTRWGFFALVLAACNALIEDPAAFKLRATGTGDGGPHDDAGSEVGVDPNAPWPMLGANAAHTSRVEIDGSPLRSTKARALKMTNASPPSAGPAVDGDGTAYIVSTDGKLTGFRVDGSFWQESLGGAARCTPGPQVHGVDARPPPRTSHRVAKR